MLFPFEQKAGPARGRKAKKPVIAKPQLPDCMIIPDPDPDVIITEPFTGKPLSISRLLDFIATDNLSLKLNFAS